jgi:low affinity Fe/Cu permease
MSPFSNPEKSTPMWPRKREGFNRILEIIAHKTTMWVGSSWAFLIAFALVLIWVITGPVFNYSDTWQLVMNTISSVVTFLMVFLIQRSQNKDSLAIQVKLNELIAATKGASNRLINIEDLTEEELEAVHDRYQKLVERVQRDRKITAAVSIEHAPGDLQPQSPPGTPNGQPKAT